MIEVKAKGGTYHIRFCDEKACFADVTDEDVLITDLNLAELYPGCVAQFHRRYVVEPGEGSKEFGVYESIVRGMAKADTKRGTRVFAFGGGVVGDLAGFVAASYMRGVPLIQVPTSLLAMVDSSVGGKVGVDLPEGKNLVGAFWPPAEVRVNLDFLSTLEHRHFRNGMAEVWKYGWIMDRGLLETLEGHPLEEGDPLTEDTVERCIRLKKEVVEEDEYESTGRRAILNFGHTIGHAMEKELGYTELLHGEAVAVGMVLEAKLGENLSLTPSGTAERVAKGMVSQKLPITMPGSLSAEGLVAAMRRDKKATSTGLAFSLVTAPGECKLITNVPEEAVLAVLNGS